MSHKSAYLLRPTEFGNLFITYRFTKKITDLPGVTLNVMEGPEHIDTDIRLGAADVYASSEERWMLEMMQQARTGKDGDIKKLQTFSSNLWGENFYELDAPQFIHPGLGKYAKVLTSISKVSAECADFVVLGQFFFNILPNFL